MDQLRSICLFVCLFVVQLTLRPVLHNTVKWTRLPGAGTKTRGPHTANEIQCAVAHTLVITGRRRRQDNVTED
jgi:hypothetical protein